MTLKFNNGVHHLFDTKAYKVVASFGLLKAAQQALAKEPRK